LTDNRNWDLLPQSTQMRRFRQSRACPPLDRKRDHRRYGFRFRVRTEHCVRERQPLHGEIKLPGMATEFYRARVDSASAHRHACDRAAAPSSALNHCHSRKPAQLR